MTKIQILEKECLPNDLMMIENYVEEVIEEVESC